jgi:hypothetical protein
MKTNKYFLSYLAGFFLELGMFMAKIVEKIRTHILCSVTFLKNHAIYEIICKNVVGLDRPPLTVWHIGIAHWIYLSLQTHTWQYLLQQWLPEPA